MGFDTIEINLVLSKTPRHLEKVAYGGHIMAQKIRLESKEFSLKIPIPPSPQSLVSNP